MRGRRLGLLAYAVQNCHRNAPRVDARASDDSASFATSCTVFAPSSRSPTGTCASPAGAAAPAAPVSAWIGASRGAETAPAAPDPERREHRGGEDDGQGVGDDPDPRRGLRAGRDEDRAGREERAALRHDRLVEAGGDVRDAEADAAADAADSHATPLRDEVADAREVRQRDRRARDGATGTPVAASDDGRAGLPARRVEREPHRAAQAAPEVVELLVGARRRGEERLVRPPGDADGERWVD